MRKVILYIATSLDGYIADKNGDVNWLQGDGSDKDNMGSYPEFIDTIDTVILGYSTYNQIITELSVDSWVYAGKTTYVFTSKDIKSDNDEIIITNDNLCEFINFLRQQSGKNIWICGGANIANQLITNDLIDEYHISTIPVILGEGIKLFTTNKNIKLKLKSTINYNGIVDLVYENR